MCGRFVQYFAKDEWDKAWQWNWHLKADLNPRYNVAPGTAILTAVMDRHGQPQAGLMHWGMKSSHGLLINARSETLSSRPTFRPLLQGHRCIVPMNGYYEWHQANRTPYFITNRSRTLWALGLYRMADAGPEVVIVTQAAQESLLFIHPRMPVFVSHEDSMLWMSVGESQASLVLERAQAAPRTLEYWPVSRAVNRAVHDSPELIEPDFG